MGLEVDVHHPVESPTTTLVTHLIREARQQNRANTLPDRYLEGIVISLMYQQYIEHTPPPL